MAVGELPDVTMQVGDNPMTVNVAEAFSGSVLTFAATSSAEDFASVTLTDTTLSIAAHAAGTATVTITTTNSGGSADQSFEATVKDMPPMAVGELPDLNLVAGGEAALVDVAGTFTGAALVYSAAGTGDAVSVTVSGSHVTVAPLVEGEATVTVTATNTTGAASLTFKATVSTDVAESDALENTMAAIGRSTLASGPEWRFALTGDAGVLEMQADGGVGIIDDMNVSVGRVKLAFEGERIIIAENGNSFSVFGQVGGRHDSGDGRRYRKRHRTDGRRALRHGRAHSPGGQDAPAQPAFRGRLRRERR